MKIKDGFMLRRFGDDSIVVAVGEGAEDFNRLITLNEVGSFIYKQLSEDKTLDELAAAIVEAYEVDEAVARADAEAFVLNLDKAGLLDG